MAEGEGEGMPFMNSRHNKLVCIKVIRLRVSEYYLTSPSPYELRLERWAASKSVPKEANWRVMWSGQHTICSLMSFHGKVITCQGEQGWFFSSYSLKLEPWPVLDTSAMWHLQIVAQSSNCKFFQAKILPVRDPRYSFEFDGFRLDIFWNYSVNLRGWIVEIVDQSSTVINDQQREMVQAAPQSVQPQPQPQPGAVFVNLVNGSGSQNMGGNYYNSGHNTNASGTQNNGGIETPEIAKLLLSYVNRR